MSTPDADGLKEEVWMVNLRQSPALYLLLGIGMKQTHGSACAR